MIDTGFLARLQAWLPLAPLLVLLAGTYWLNQQVQPLPTKPDESKRHEPDYILDNFSATTLNKQGAPRFLLDAQRMQHYPDDDSTHLDQPHLYSLYAENPPISISAETGEISRNGDEVFLRDQVRIVRSASARQGEMVISTDYLHVVPDDDLADTDRAITMKDDHSVVDSVGMKLNYKTRKITLLADVKGRYEPAKH